MTDRSSCAPRSSFRLTRLVFSPALGAVAMFGFGGIGFAIANVLLARVLPSTEFAVLALFLALHPLGYNLGPLGLEVSINRHRFDFSKALLNRALITSAAVGIVIAIVAHYSYGIAAAMAISLAVTVVASGSNRAAAAFLQSRRRFLPSLLMTQAHNYVLLCAVPFILLTHTTSALAVTLFVGFAYIASTAIGWRAAARLPRTHSPQLSNAELLKEGIPSVGIGFGLQMLGQLERLLIPVVLSMQDLASFAVIAAIAASPYRMMQIGTGYTLLPTLRAAETRSRMMRLLAREALAMGIVLVVATVAVIELSPFVLERFLGGRYSFSSGLLLAMIVVGFIKVWNGFAGTVVTAFGTAREMMTLNILAWAGIAIGAACAALMSSAGLIGIVYGVGLAWLVRGVAATIIGIRCLQTWPRPVPAAV